MNSKYQLSAVSPSEYPRIVEIWEAAVRATHHFLSNADIEFFRPLVAHEALPSVQLTCVRDRSQQILGFMGMAEDKVEMLFVDPAYHGQGIGRALMTYAITGCGATLVDVNEQNPGALAFYLRLGFEVRERSPLDSLGKPFPILHLQLKQPHLQSVAIMHADA